MWGGTSQWIARLALVLLSGIDFLTIQAIYLIDLLEGVDEYGKPRSSTRQHSIDSSCQDAS